MFLLDTNVLSEFRRARPHGGVKAWVKSLPTANIYVPAVVLGEIQIGIQRTRQHDLAKAREIEAWADAISHSFNILPMDGDIFRAWARLIEGKPGPAFADSMIAATALCHTLIVATRNVTDFKQFGVATLNPFEHA